MYKFPEDFDIYEWQSFNRNSASSAIVDIKQRKKQKAELMPRILSYSCIANAALF